MKQKILMMVTFTILLTGAFAQKMAKKSMGSATGKKTQAFGVHFNLGDFNGAKAFKNDENTGNTSLIKDMALGVGFSYWKGITGKVDFSLKLNGMFYDYSIRQYNVSKKTEIGIELEPTINIRPFNDDNLWAPFLTAGIGAGLYTDHIGSYVPLGVGIQFNGGHGATYLFIQAQYRASLTKKVIPDHLFYSIGIAQSF